MQQLTKLRKVIDLFDHVVEQRIAFNQKGFYGRKEAFGRPAVRKRFEFRLTGQLLVHDLAET